MALTRGEAAASSAARQGGGEAAGETPGASTTGLDETGETARASSDEEATSAVAGTSAPGGAVGVPPTDAASAAPSRLGLATTDVETPLDLGLTAGEAAGEGEVATEPTVFLGLAVGEPVKLSTRAAGEAAGTGDTDTGAPSDVGRGLGRGEEGPLRVSTTIISSWMIRTLSAELGESSGEVGETGGPDETDRADGRAAVESTSRDGTRSSDSSESQLAVPGRVAAGVGGGGGGPMSSRSMASSTT